MDQSTHDVRRTYWQDIVKQCQNRPLGMTTKQWLEDNGIKNKAYYYWLRKFRKETCAKMNLPSVNATEEITFAEINSSFPMTTFKADVPAKTNDTSAAVIRCNAFSIEISNNISEELLTCLLREICHA